MGEIAKYPGKRRKKGDTLVSPTVCFLQYVNDPGTNHAQKTQNNAAYQHQAQNLFCVHFVSLALRFFKSSRILS